MIAGALISNFKLLPLGTAAPAKRIGQVDSFLNGALFVLFDLVRGC